MQLDQKVNSSNKTEKKRLRGAADRMQPHILTDNEYNPRSNRNIKPVTIKIIHAAIEI